jgi:hypothetical protein
MTPAQFRTIGLALHGPAWQHALAASLHLDPRTVSRYARNENPVPEKIRKALVALLHEKSAALLEQARAVRVTAS